MGARICLLGVHPAGCYEPLGLSTMPSQDLGLRTRVLGCFLCLDPSFPSLTLCLLWPWGSFLKACVRVCSISSAVSDSFATPMDCSLPGSSVHGILQARRLEWAAIPSSRGSCWPRDQIHIFCISFTASGFSTCWAIFLKAGVPKGPSVEENRTDRPKLALWDHPNSWNQLCLKPADSMISLFTWADQFPILQKTVTLGLSASWNKKGHNWDFPGSPVVRTLSFHCRGHKFNPWLGK